MKTFLIAISGKMRHGKDTIGDYLIARYGFKHIGFADKLKQICQTYEETDRDACNKQIAAELFPEQDKTVVNDIDVLMRAAQPDGWQKLTEDECYDNKTDLSRRVLQHIGDGMRFVRGQADVWARFSLATCQSGRHVITDVRYKNEAFAIDALPHSQIWRVNRKIEADPRSAKHISEVDLDDYPFEVVIENNDTIPHLYNKIDKIMKPLEQGRRPFLTGEEVY